MSDDLFEDTQSQQPFGSPNSAFRIYRPCPKTKKINQYNFLDRFNVALTQLTFLNDYLNTKDKITKMCINHLNREENCLVKSIESFIDSVDDLYAYTD